MMLFFIYIYFSLQQSLKEIIVERKKTFGVQTKVLLIEKTWVFTLGTVQYNNYIVY